MARDKKPDKNALPVPPYWTTGSSGHTPIGSADPTVWQGGAGGRIENEIVGGGTNGRVFPPDTVLTTDGKLIADEGLGLIYRPNARESPWLFVGELLETRVGNPMNSTYERTYVRRFLVRTYRKDVGAAIACEAPGIPRPYSPYVPALGIEYDLDALAVNIDAVLMVPDDRQTWIVTVSYSTQMPEEGPDGFHRLPRNQVGSQTDPTYRPAKLVWDEEEVQVAPPRDLDGRVYATSAGQPFSPAPTFPTPIAVLVMTRYEKDFGRKTITDYGRALNSDVFLGCKPGTVQCMPPRAEQKWIGTRMFWKVTWRFRFGGPKPKNAEKNPGLFDILAAEAFKAMKIEDLTDWQPEILDQGTHRKQTADGAPAPKNLVPIFMNGVTVSNPVLLDGNGQPQKPNEDGWVKPVFLKFRQFHTKPFNAIFGNAVREIEGS